MLPEGVKFREVPQLPVMFLVETSVHLRHLWIWWEIPVPPWESVSPTDWGSPCAPKEWGDRVGDSCSPRGPLKPQKCPRGDPSGPGPAWFG